MSHKFVGCTAFIYDTDGVLLTNANIRKHNSYENYIIISKCPELYTGMRCELIILSEPAPYAYSGVVREDAADNSIMIITLFKGRVKESRSAKRYKLTGSAEITGFIDDDNKKNDLRNPIEVNLINISARGVRFSSRTNTLPISDRFDLKLKIGNNDKILATKVIDIRASDSEKDSTEYGCLFEGVVDE